MRRVCLVVPVDEVGGCSIVFGKSLTEFMAVIAGRNTHYFAVFIFLDVAVLKHLTVYEEAVRHRQRQTADILVAEGYVPEVVLLGLGIERIGRQTYVFCGVISETAGAESYEVVDIFHVIVLEIRVFGIDVGESAHFAGCTLHTVIIVCYIGETVGMEKIFVAADRIVKAGQHGRMVDGCVVGQHVNDDTDTIIVGAVAHRFECIAVTEHIVAYGPVCRLVIVVPLAHYRVAFHAEKCHAAVVADEASLGGRCLHVVVAGFCYLTHVGGDCVE